MIRAIGIALLLFPASAFGEATPEIKPPSEIGAAYGRLGKAMMSHDIEGVRRVWAEDFVVNSPNNEVLTREQVIAAMENDFLSYKDFRKHITSVSEKPEVTVIMGYDTMIPIKGPGAGKQVMRPFTDVWAKRSGTWLLIARQATIAAVI